MPIRGPRGGASGSGGGASGLAAVVHDATLAGRGTAADPLGVAPADVSAAVAADGARAEYDRAAHRLRFAAQDGAAIQYDAGAHALSAALPAGATVSIVADGGVSIEGDVSVTGDVTATGDVTDRRSSMEAMRGVYDGHVHPAGTPPGNTAATAQRMRS